jgi:hypothetical protein
MWNLKTLLIISVSLQCALSSFQDEDNADDAQLEAREYENFCSLSIDCDGDEFCDFSNKAPGTCMKKLPEFYPCYYNHQCLTDKCSWRFQCEISQRQRYLLKNIFRQFNCFLKRRIKRSLI